MKRKKCPYCGRRVSYSSAFNSRRKAEYVCKRCGRESRVVINRTVIPVFIICAVLSAVVFFLWVYFRMTYNPLGILAVALPLIIFGIISPKFVRFEPLRKYKKTMEAKRAGAAFSDNLLTADTEDEGVTENSGAFKINPDLFSKIKSERSAVKEQGSDSDVISSYSGEVQTEDNPYVHVIDDISEGHAVDDAPLKKLHSEGSRIINRTSHYFQTPEETPAEESAAEEEDVKEYKRPDNNRYSGNRRF